MRFSWHSVLLRLFPIFGITFGIISLSQKSTSQWLSPYIVTSLYFLSLLCLIPLLFYSVYNAFKKAKFGFQIFIFVLLLFLLALCLDYIFNTHIFAERKYLRENIFAMLIVVIISFKLIIDYTFQFSKRAVALILILFSFVPFTYNFLYNLYLDPYELFFKSNSSITLNWGIESIFSKLYNNKYDAIIIGSSQEMGIKNIVFDKVLGKKYGFSNSTSLTFWSMTDYTQIRLMQMALNANPSIKVVYFGYYAPGEHIGSDYKDADKSDYLFDDSRLNDFRFFYEKSVKEMKNKLNHRYSSQLVNDWWFPIHHQNFNQVLTFYSFDCRFDVSNCTIYDEIKLDGNITDEEEIAISRYVSRLNFILLKYPDVKFILYNQLWYSRSKYLSGHYRYNLIKRILMLGHKNIEIFMPRSDFILGRPDMFGDYFHQHPYIHTMYLKDLENDKYLVKNISDLDNYYEWYNNELVKSRKNFSNKWNYAKFENYYDNLTPVFNKGDVAIWNSLEDNAIMIRTNHCDNSTKDDYIFEIDAKDDAMKDFLLYAHDLLIFTKGDNCYIEQGLPYKDWSEHYTATSVRLNLKYHDMYLLKDVVLNLTPTKWRPPAPIQEIIDKKEDYIVLKSDFDKYLIKNN